MADKIPARIENRIMTLLKAGLKYETIAKAADVSLATVTRVANRNGYAKPKYFRF